MWDEPSPASYIGHFGPTISKNLLWELRGAEYGLKTSYLLSNPNWEAAASLFALVFQVLFLKFGFKFLYCW
jgi:hypothetical protein